MLLSTFSELIQTIGEKVKTFLEFILGQAVTFLSSLEWYFEALILIVLVVLLVFGLIKFIEISWKLILVLIVLGGIAVLVYFLVIKKGDTTNAIYTFNFASSILKFIL